MKGVVTDIRGRYAAVLDETGSVTRIRDRGYAIGEEIEFTDEKPVAVKRSVCRIAAAAAVLLAILNIGAGVAYAVPYGTVSVDVNPSIEYTVNIFDYVLSVKGVNADGEAILSELDTRSLRHHRIDDAVVLTVEQIEKDGFFEKDGANVLIAAGTKNESHSVRLASSLEERINNDLDLPTHSISVEPADVERAHEAGTTAGRQWEKEQNVGPSPKPEQDRQEQPQETPSELSPNIPQTPENGEPKPFGSGDSDDRPDSLNLPQETGDPEGAPLLVQNDPPSAPDEPMPPDSDDSPPILAGDRQAPPGNDPPSNRVDHSAGEHMRETALPGEADAKIE